MVDARDVERGSPWCRQPRASPIRTAHLIGARGTGRRDSWIRRCSRDDGESAHGVPRAAYSSIAAGGGREGRACTYLRDDAVGGVHNCVCGDHIADSSAATAASVVV